PRVLSHMRIRKKLVFLHTLFSLTLAAILILALRPAIGAVIRHAETEKAQMALWGVAAGARPPEDVTVAPATEADVPEPVRAALAEAGRPVAIGAVEEGARAAMRVADGSLLIATARITSARQEVLQLYGLLVLSLLAVYGLIAVALELFVLPQHVYGPIRRL